MTRRGSEVPFPETAHLLKRGRLEEAFQLFLKAARAGNARAQLNVGYLYDTGQGVDRSRAQALAWYRKAVRQGEALAAANIGTLYRDEGRLRLAVRWFQKAAAMGEEESLLEVARLYVGPLEELAKARKLLTGVLASKRAAASNREEARRLLGLLERRERMSRSGRAAR